MLSDETSPVITRNLSWQAAVAVAFAVVMFLVPSPALGQAQILEANPGLPDFDARTGTVAPTSTQLAIVSDLGATARWNEFGTPKSLIKQGGYLATGLSGDSAVTAARSWIDANKALFGLASTDGLTLYVDSKLALSNGHAVNFRQVFGGLPATNDGLVTVGITGTPEGGWKVAYVSSSLTRDTALAAQPQISAIQAWLNAAANVGRGVSLINVGSTKIDREWTVFGVSGFADLQRARLVAVPTPLNGVRPAFEALVLDNQDGSLTGYRTFIDAENGAVLIRQNVVFQSHPPSAAFTGTVPTTDGCDDADQGPWVIGPLEPQVASIDVVASANIPANDIVIHLIKDGVVVASADTLFSPETIHYAPAGGVPPGTYTVRACDFQDGVPWDVSGGYSGTITFNDLAPGAVPYPPKWRVFPASPLLSTTSGFPWMIPSTDIRKLWCWDSNIQGVPIAGCEDEVGNLAARVPWDFNVNTGTPTFTTTGNAADSSEAWTNPLAPGPFGFRPPNINRTYDFPFTNAWFTSNCDPTTFVPGTTQDISAAVTNLFAMHNRMHDWSYFLGFTEENWNAQQDNFGNAGAENDPVLGQAQAGAVSSGWPSYLGRDNANMRPLPDGVSSITNMYLWQPLRAAFYAPCVDGDYDMSVIGHEYTHMTENRMIGKGNTRSGHHAGAMGESAADLNAMEILNEYGFVPINGENRYAVGPYATGNRQRGIRNYGMNQSPLNFSNMGYDAFAADPVHANGEIWSATNFDIRQALVNKYNASFPESNQTLQRKCADGLNSPENCPGNRRWIQIMYDAFLLMPTAPSMLDSRDAYLAADLMRNADDPAWPTNQTELWLAFARRGFGQGAESSNTNATSDTDPKPDFASPLHSNATVNFAAFASDEGNTPITNARIYVGQYEARTSPIADTNPSTNTGGTNSLDDTASFAPGTYEFLVQAPGYGAAKFSRTFTAGQNVTLSIAMPTNWASSTKGATTSGDGSAAEQANLIDDTESTNWTFTGAPVSGKQVTVDLPGTSARIITRVQVSASLNAQNRFSALRQFRIDVSTNGTTFTPVFTSAPDTFPGAPPRPVLPDLILRSFTLPSPVSATHVRLVVLTNECTGQSQFQGVQDADIPNPTDCRGQGEPLGTDPGGLANAVGGIPVGQGTTVRAAEFQVFSSSGTVSNASTLTLSPQTASNVVGTQHCVTATLVNGSGSPIKNATIRFSVSGANTASGSGNTNNSGQRTFCYTGANQGNDTISAYADLNKNGVQDNGEPGDTASKTWVPQSTAGCEVKITNGGAMVANNGDPASFGGNAVGFATGANGQEEYNDHGPGQPINVHSINVQSVTCSQDRTMASIFGQATIDAQACSTTR